MKREVVACYVRVSSQDQKLHGYSIEAQKEKLTAYAEAHNMKIFGFYVDEGVSGRKPIRKRPELMRLISDAEKRLFDRIIFIKLDRFFRSVGEYHEAMKRISPVEWTATEEQYDTSTSSGRFFITSKLAVAEMEADQTGERLRLVNDYKAKTGRAVTGNLPVGYKISGPPGDKRVVKDPEKEAAAKLIIDTFRRTGSYRATAIAYDEAYGASWSATDAKTYFSRTLLYGSYRGNDSFCEPYMTKKEWDDIQRIGQHPPRKPKKHTYIFSGLIHCPECGGRMAAHTWQKGNDPKRYRCTTHYTRPTTCSYGLSLGEKAVEQYLLENIAGIIENEEVREYKLRGPKKKNDTARIRARMERLNYSWEEGRISVEEYDRRYKELEKMLNEPEKETRDFEKLRKTFSKPWREKYAMLDDEHKAMFWRGIIDRIEVEGRKPVKIVFL